MNDGEEIDSEEPMCYSTLTIEMVIEGPLEKNLIIQY